jgi:hypothetical protein
MTIKPTVFFGGWGHSCEKTKPRVEKLVGMGEGGRWGVARMGFDAWGIGINGSYCMERIDEFSNVNGIFYNRFMTFRLTTFRPPLFHQSGLK